MPLLYNLLLLLLSPLLALYLAHRLLIKGKSRDGFGQRLGFAPRLAAPPEAGRVWLHAVSAGEVVAAAAIVRKLVEREPGVEVAVSTTTPAGFQQAQRLIPGAVAHFYFPFDFLACVLLALRRIRPTTVAAVETEIWPNWLWAASALGIRTALVNGQFADKGFRGARRFRWLYRWALGRLDRLWMQSDQAAERALYLGAPPERVRRVGNVKFDQPLPPPKSEALAAVRAVLGSESPIWIAASTHPGEEEQVLEAFRAARQRIPNLRLLLAPRHVERSTDVLELIRSAGWSVQRRSAVGAPAEVLLLDTMGELAGLYSLADVVFVGGSLVPIGGHDVFQPLLHGKPTLFGPHMHNQHDIAQMVREAGAGLQVSSAAELADAVVRMVNEPALREELTRKAACLLQLNTGAAQECGDLLAQLASGKLPPPTGDAWPALGKAHG